MTSPVLDPAALERLTRLGGDALVAQMIALFLENGPARIRALVDSAADGSADGVERAAHTLKSSAGNVGAVRLQAAAEDLEATASDGEIDADMIERVRQDYEQTVAALRAVRTKEQ